MKEVELTEYQLQHIEERLLDSGMKYEPLREELLDHICCEVEERMQAGNTFETAMSKAFAKFGQKELRQLQKQTIFLIHYKKKIMKVITLTAVVLLAYFPTFYGAEQGPPSIHPLGEAFKITGHFGPATHPLTKASRLHKGIDFKAPLGTAVKAGGEGTVKEVNENTSGYGLHIIIDHGDGYETLYAHLSEILVQKGETIDSGQLIGKVGSTGASTGPHLHYEVRKNGIPENPLSYLE